MAQTPLRNHQRENFEWKPFSKKQKQILSWWASPICAGYDGIIADGAVRSGKTVSMAISFVLWAMSTFRDTDFALCGKTVGSLRRNVINTLKRQLASLDLIAEERRTDNLLIVSLNGTVNYFYLFGGRDESSQDLIQGMTLGGVLFDEVALMPESFVAQAEARCSLEGSKLWYNCNPRGPAHYFKTEYVNRHAEKRLIYLHFTMNDNLTLSEDVKERYRRRFTGVFYDRNILGLWVTAEGKIYTAFTKECILPVQEWHTGVGAAGELKQRLQLVTMGVDFGGSGSSTAFVLTGFTRSFRETIVLKEKRIKEELNPSELDEAFVAFTKDCVAEYPQLHDVYADSAEQILIRGLRNAARLNNLPVAIHNARKGEIIDRIRFGTAMFAQHRYYMLSDCTETIRAFTDAVWDEDHEDTRLDDGTTNIDNIDATEYSQEPFMKAMIDLRTEMR